MSELLNQGNQEQDPMLQNDPHAQAEEKTFTQADIDEIVKERLSRDRKKYADYYQNKERLQRLETENMTLKELSVVLNEANVEGTPAEQINQLRSYYGLTKKQAEQVVDASANKGAEDDTKSFINATRFERKASDDDVVDEVERILEIPAHKRNEGDNAKLEVLENRYGAIKFKSDYNEAKKAFDSIGEGDFAELISSDEFKDFAEGSNAPLKTIVQKYLKYAGKTKQPKSPGSAKDTGGTTAKEFYSPAEVDKLTEEQLSNPKIWEKVRESMTKWK